MGSTRDFLRSIATDAALPVTRQLLEDVVMETLNERQVPTRTDYQELRDVVNQMRGQASSAANGTKKLGKKVSELQAQVEALMAQNAALQQRIEELEAR